MDFWKDLGRLHVYAKEIPCLTGPGAPGSQTEGAPGVLYMDTDSGALYKCRGGEKGAWRWESATPVRGVDYYTEADKAELVELVLQALGGTMVFGYVDSGNNIIISNLADGSYKVMYEMSDGSTLEIGSLELDSTVYYRITGNLTNCISSNGAVEAAGGESYEATITANDGFELKSVTVTMGGAAVAVSGGNISIPSVTGDIVITAVATVVETVTATNFCVVNGDGWISGGRCSSSGADREDSEAYAVTNYIAVQNGDEVYVENLEIATATYSGLYKSDTDKTAIGGFIFASGAVANYVKDVTLSNDGGQFTIDNANAGYIRICGEPTQGIIGTTGTFEQHYDINNMNIIVNIKRNGAWL